MATIVNFKPADPSLACDDVRAQNMACEIILFPGVRYERWVDTPEAPAKSSVVARKPRAKKRKLEMAD